MMCGARAGSHGHADPSRARAALALSLLLGAGCSLDAFYIRPTGSTEQVAEEYEDDLEQHRTIAPRRLEEPVAPPPVSWGSSLRAAIRRFGEQPAQRSPQLFAEPSAGAGVAEMGQRPYVVRKGASSRYKSLAAPDEVKTRAASAAPAPAGNTPPSRGTALYVMLGAAALLLLISKVPRSARSPRLRPILEGRLAARYRSPVSRRGF